jgi:hypothetical protein
MKPEYQRPDLCLIHCHKLSITLTTPMRGKGYNEPFFFYSWNHYPHYVPGADATDTGQVSTLLSFHNKPATPFSWLR